MAHEFGHAFGLAQEPFNSYSSAVTANREAKLFGRPASCQHPDNRFQTFARTAMDWQERFINLLNTMNP